MQDTMTSKSQDESKPVVRALTVRWPEDFWEIVSIEATKRRTTTQAIITEAVRQYLGLPTTSESQDPQTRKGAA